MSKSILISHESALELHRIAMLLGLSIVPTDITNPPSNRPAVSDLPALEKELRAVMCGLPISSPIHICVNGERRVRQIEPWSIHQCSLKLPRKSIFRLSEHICIASPALAFVQAAKGRTVEQAALLALEYCGIYSTIPFVEDAGYRVAPVAAKAALDAFAETNSSLHGAAQARRALRFVRDGSASIRESKLMLLLCVPACRGGFGVAPPVFNHEVACTERAWEISGRRTLRCDLCWPEAMLDVEYQSRKHHEGESHRISDSRRANALSEMGFTVIQITNEELDAIVDMSVIAGNIKKRLGMSTRSRVTDFDRKHQELRKRLRLPVRFG